MIRVHKGLIIVLAALVGQACTREPPSASHATASSEAGGADKAMANADIGPSPSMRPGSDDPADATYSIDGEAVALSRGVGLLSPSAGKALGAGRIRMVGGPLSGDLDKDGDEDAIVLLSLEVAGKSPRYYLAGALQSHGKFSGDKSLFLGGTISQPSLHYSNDRISASYYLEGVSPGSVRGMRTVQAKWNGRRFELL
ncbi:hypothetical protein ABU614_16990 [Lysobacter firmicutimachus]|uniref:VCBS repeat-containing protein n=1 Tax=Lysobacter firmicutimachus TaxID=1792846 RepID=A0AAU8MR33_9GAMM